MASRILTVDAIMIEANHEGNLKRRRQTKANTGPRFDSSDTLPNTTQHLLETSSLSLILRSK